MEEKARTIEWSIQLLYDLHWALKKNGLDSPSGQAVMYDIIASMAEHIRDSSIKIAELEQEINHLKALNSANLSSTTHSSPNLATV
jgi:hypothetical protein